MVVKFLLMLATAIQSTHTFLFQRNSVVPTPLRPPAATILGIASESAPVPTATIKTTVGTYQYKGCFQDNIETVPPATTVVHTLIPGISVSGGVNAERCTAACKALGYPLAGLEDGQECFCDSYMDIVNLVPDSECSTPFYEDTAAPPPSTQQYITGNIDTPVDFSLQLVPFPNGGTPTPLAAIMTDTNTRLFSLTEDIASPAENFRLFFFQDNRNFNLSQMELWLDYTEEAGTSNNFVSLAPVAGGGLFFTAGSGMSPSTFNHYCGHPSPIPQFGPFIGPTVLTINGQFNQWALCPNTTASGRLDVVFAPIANSPDYTLS